MIYNPYFSSTEEALRPISPQNSGILDGILDRLKSLEGEDILLILLLVVLLKNDQDRQLLPLIGALVYLLL